MTSQNNQSTTTALTLTLFILPILYLTHRQKKLSAKRHAYNAEREKERAFLHNLTLHPNMQPLRPPLPDIVRTILGRCRFAYLSTMDVDAKSSHLSLMRFTYLAEEELTVTAEIYREAHLKNNPEYPQFIVGKDIAMLRVDVLSARICNINDEVIKWNVESK
eukprot:scaffold88678_cov79-Cyclotella_meneghiniana.AAC.1